MRLRAALAGILLLWPLACTETSTELVPEALAGDRGEMDGGADDDVGARPAPSDRDAAAAPERERAVCGGSPCACDNGEDDDGDGEIDGLDPECTGPFDDDEESFATGIPGGNMDFCHDCFWDNNSGDDEGCQYHSDCRLGLTPTTGGESSCFDCEVSDACIDNCVVRTPSGCDCFGCCEVTVGGDATVTVLLEESCATKHAEDPERCPPCVQHETCRNECGECELCPGRKAKDLPDSCKRGGGAQPDNACEEGEQVCDNDNPCPPDLWCQLGCCEFIPL